MLGAMSVKAWLNETTEGQRLQQAEDARRAAEPQPKAAPFDPITQVSADAKYIVKHLVLWFLVLPVVLGVLVWAVASALR